MVKRKIYWNVLFIGLTACFSFCLLAVSGQTVQTITDRKDILIGEQIKLTIKAALPPQATIKNWLALPDSIPHFEIVGTGLIDTVEVTNELKSVEQTLTVTSFDSGRWAFPALSMAFNVPGKPAQKIKSDSFIVNVSYATPDSTNKLRDIKPIIKVKVTDYFWYYIIGGIILLLLIGYLLYRYFKVKNKYQPEKGTAKISPYDEAMQQLKELDSVNLQDAVEIKKYHSALSAIFKNYLGRKKQISLLNKTTGELLIVMKEAGFSTENISDLAMVLRCTDAVKFAKYRPLINESETCLQTITKTINLIVTKLVYF